ncbi:uncharacterized protein EV154DRAFT_88414 [Mucor mucedo]|uniref:uncharacterized protein n=1 Tax=Mucor mucedo TaxID=29922 RepID=UPI00221F2EDA|nr:uncharacterized protein EV154DRAFT_88414 [Mucor mucedo]KAI7873750.1 hypothetical protein EV154DRAFT_88414 [Mucor mucedo]
MDNLLRYEIIKYKKQFTFHNLIYIVNFFKLAFSCSLELFAVPVIFALYVRNLTINISNMLFFLFGYLFFSQHVHFVWIDTGHVKIAKFGHVYIIVFRGSNRSIWKKESGNGVSSGSRKNGNITSSSRTSVLRDAFQKTSS